MTKEQFYNEAKVFLTNIFEQIEKNNIKLHSNWSIDHICYRTSTLDSYAELKTQFAKFGELLT